MRLSFNHANKLTKNLNVLLEVIAEHELLCFIPKNLLTIILNLVSLIGIFVSMLPCNFRVKLGSFIFVAWVTLEFLFFLRLLLLNGFCWGLLLSGTCCERIMCRCGVLLFFFLLRWCKLFLKSWSCRFSCLFFHGSSQLWFWFFHFNILTSTWGS